MKWYLPLFCVLIAGIILGVGSFTFADGLEIIEESGITKVKGAQIDSTIGAKVASVGISNVIFNNFGPGDTYYINSGLTVSTGQPINSDVDSATAFAPAGGDYILTKIELAVGLQAGPNELDVWLMSDDGGKPGGIIETFHFSGAMGPFGTFNPPLAADSVLKPILGEGMQYWLVASVTGPDAWAGWNFNSIGDNGTLAQRFNMGPWNVHTGRRPVCRISGMLYVDVDVDIKPGSCPNPLNPKSKGVTPVAIVHSEDFDPADVDPATVTLAGVSPLKWEMLDSTMPHDGDPADCDDCFDADTAPPILDCDGDGDVDMDDGFCGDGLVDLVLYFDTQELAAAIDDTGCIELILEGETLSGLDFQGSDSVRIKMGGKPAPSKHNTLSTLWGGIKAE